MAKRQIRSPEQIIRQFVKQLAEHYPLDVVVLYGSYARGWQKEWSDLDLAVVSSAFNRCTPAKWNKVRKIAADISPMIDARPFGTKEFQNFELGDFVHEIRRIGKPVYAKGRFSFSKVKFKAMRGRFKGMSTVSVRDESERL